MTSAPPSNSPAPVFRAPCGDIEGWADGDLVRATGIPYATADRFESPVPVRSLAEYAASRRDLNQRDLSQGDLRQGDATGRFAATDFSPCAPQIDDPNLAAIFGEQNRDLGISEDCLRVSVTAPAGVQPGDKLPVMVWVHGGSYTVGCGDSSVTDPADLVREQRVVVVTVTYRLGLLGFLGTAHGPGNLGLLDIREAFRWVRRNIAAFGGDPRRITAFGESAGADAIAHLMAAMGDELVRAGRELTSDADNPAASAELLFDRAILMSPPLGIRHGRSRMNAAMSAFVEPQITRVIPHRELVVLQEKTALKMARFGLPGMMPFGTQYGQDPLPEEGSVEQAWRAIAANIPVMIGTVGTETSLFAHTMPIAQKLKRTPRVGPPLYWKLVDVTSRIVFEKPARDFAKTWRSAGGSAHRYVIPWSVPGNVIRSPHAIDVAILFAREDSWREVLPFEGAAWPEIRTAARDLRRYFGEFARFDTLAPLTREPRVVRSA